MKEQEFIKLMEQVKNTKDTRIVFTHCDEGIEMGWTAGRGEDSYGDKWWWLQSGNLKTGEFREYEYESVAEFLDAVEPHRVDWATVEKVDW